MRRILIGVLSVHWLVIFGLLAGATMLCATDGAAALNSFGLPGGDMPSGSLAYAGLALGCSLVALLFLWTLVSLLADEGKFPDETDEIAPIAFGAGVAMCTVMMVMSALGAAVWLLSSIAVQMGALLISYLVFYADRRASFRRMSVARDDVRATAARMALGAAHNSLLPRLSGSVGEVEPG